MLKPYNQELNVAVSTGELALEEASSCKMEHLDGIAARKLVIFPVKELRVLLEVAWVELERRGIIRT